MKKNQQNFGVAVGLTNDLAQATLFSHCCPNLAPQETVPEGEGMVEEPVETTPETPETIPEITEGEVPAPFPGELVI